MNGREQPEPPAAGGALVVVFGRKPRHGLGQLAGELRPPLRVGEPHLGVEREGGDPLSLAPRLSLEDADVANDPARGSDEVGAAQPIRRRIGTRPENAEGLGADDERPGGGADDTLEAVPLAPLLDQLDQTRGLEGAEMVVDPLAGKSKTTGEAGRGIGLGQVREKLLADGIEHRGGGLGSADDLEGRCRHGVHDDTDRLFCQDIDSFPRGA